MGLQKRSEPNTRDIRNRLKETMINSIRLSQFSYLRILARMQIEIDICSNPSKIGWLFRLFITVLEISQSIKIPNLGDQFVTVLEYHNRILEEYKLTFHLIGDRPESRWLRSSALRVRACWRRSLSNTTTLSPPANSPRSFPILLSPFPVLHSPSRLCVWGDRKSNGT